MRKIVLIVSFFLILTSGWIAFTAGAVEPVGRNIIYIHVPASICSLVCFTVLFVCSIQYLRTKSDSADYTAAASAEVGLIFATVLNLTGMIFAKSEWGIWWTPSMRLISSAILWFLYVAYLILRTSIEGRQRKGVISAVFGIIAFIDVPLVFVSARFLRDIHRPSFSFESGWQNIGFFLNIVGTLFLVCFLVHIRMEIFKMKNRIEQLRIE